ncbi:MAG: hypothetical protein ACQEUZ_06240 [Pseudomonadota bacterium]
MQTEAPFTTLDEAIAWFEEGKARHGARAFTATAEYHEHYSAFRALYDADKPNRDARKAAKKKSRVGRPAVNLLGRALHGAY